MTLQFYFWKLILQNCTYTRRYTQGYYYGCGLKKNNLMAPSRKLVKHIMAHPCYRKLGDLKKVRRSCNDRGQATLFFPLPAIRGKSHGGPRKLVQCWKQSPHPGSRSCAGCDWDPHPRSASPWQPETTGTDGRKGGPELRGFGPYHR